VLAKSTTRRWISVYITSSLLLITRIQEPRQGPEHLHKVEETSLLSQRSTHLPRIGVSMVIDRFCTSGHNARAFRLPLGESATTLECAFCTEKSRHTFAHRHALHAFIVRNLQYCVRVGTVGPLAITSEGASRLIPSQAVYRSLYQRR
jgi:hypothetical protein